MDDGKVKPIKHYTESERQVKAVEIFKDLQQFIIDKYGSVEISVAHLATCILEEAANRAVPHDKTGDILVTAARMIAPTILDEVIIENKKALEADATDSKVDSDDIVFTMPGSDEIN